MNDFHKKEKKFIESYIVCNMQDNMHKYDI